MNSPAVPDYPAIYVTAITDAQRPHAWLLINGQRKLIEEPTMPDVRDAVRTELAALARRVKRPVRMYTCEERDVWAVIVDGNGGVAADQEPPQDLTRLRRAVCRGGTRDNPFPTADQHRMPPAPPPEPTTEVPSRATTDVAAGLLDKIGSQSSPRRPRPEKGWRRSLYDMTGGRWNPGLSKEEREEQRLMDLIRTPLPPGVMNIMVWSQKGGVGKTTLWTILGIASASVRTDKVLGLDVNPDGGSASVRVPRTTDRTILDLRDALRQRPLTPVEFDQYVNHAAHRYDSIVMPPGKKPAQPLSSADYDMLVDGLESRYPYKLVFTDCGTNLSDPVMDSVFAHAHQMVVVTTTVKDEATVTAGGLEALIREGREDLVRNAITVLVEKAPRDPDIQTQREVEATGRTIHDHFSEVTRAVVPVPYDSRIRIGGVIDPATISARSKLAYLRVAGELITGLTSPG